MCIEHMVLILDGNSEKDAQVKEQYLLSDQFKAFDYMESSHKSGYPLFMRNYSNHEV